MANSVTFKFAGLAGIRDVLKKLPEETQKKVLRPAIAKSAKPLLAAAKAKAPVRSGALRASLTSLVRKGKRDGLYYAAVGPSSDYFMAGKRVRGDASRVGADKPANYAHLVEFGHMSAAATGVNVASAAGSARVRGGRSKKTVFSARSFILPKPFMRPAFMNSKDQVEQVMAQEIQRGLADAVKRIAGNKAAKG